MNPSTTGYQNSEISNLFSPDSNFSGRVMPAVGLEYRYPFVADFGPLGVHTVSPIAQVIARPSETHIGRLPNEDAQSLVFDDTSLFQWDKFSGYNDRVEGGVRANLGAEYSITGRNGFYMNAMFGESIALAGVNSFRRGDIVNVGRDSGLETTGSDFVSRFQVSPNQNISFITRPGSTQHLRAQALRERRDGEVRAVPAARDLADLRPLRGAAQLGYDRRREGLQASALYNVTPNWFVTGSVLFDLSHYLQVREFYATAAQAYFLNPVGTAPTYDRPDKFYVSSSGFGVG